MQFNNKLFFVVNVDWFFLSHRLELALAVKAMGYEVYILTKDTGKAETIKRHGLNFINIDFERSGKNPFKEFGLIYQLIKLYQKYQPAIVHHVTIKPALYGSIVKRITNNNIKVINAISGLGYNFIGERKGLLQKVLSKLMNFAFKRNVNFIFQNPDDIKVYSKLGYLKNNSYKLIKGAGVDDEVFNFVPPIIKEKLQIIITARMLRDKGVMEFIAAAKILEKSWKEKAVFRLIGDIDIENLACITAAELKELTINDYIVWEGHRSDIQTVLIEADIVCLPSYREGLPKSLIEAMAIGRPIVSTDVPGCRECVEEGVNGFLVPAQDSVTLANAIEILLNNKDLRIQMGAASRKKMEKELSLKKVISQTLSFYKEVLTGNISYNER